MSVENIDLESMTEIWNGLLDISRQKDLELQKLKEANSGSVINLRLKLLKEENEKLKKNLPKDNSDGWYGGCEVDFKNLQEKFTDAVQEINQRELEKVSLKEENENLKVFVMNIHNSIMGTGYNDPEIVDSMDFDYIIKKNEDEIQKLKEEMKHKESVFSVTHKKLKEEIEQLKKPKPKKTITCSHCKTPGHNKKYCPHKDEEIVIPNQNQ